MEWVGRDREREGEGKRRKGGREGRGKEERGRKEKGHPPICWPRTAAGFSS